MSSRRRTTLGSRSLRADLSSSLGSGVHPGVRSELLELKSSLNNLTRDARAREKLDIESHSTFEYLKAQVEALRAAFDTMSEVLVEEADTIRAEGAEKWENLERQMKACSKTVYSMRSGLAKSQAESDAFRALVRGTLDTQSAQLAALRGEVEHLRRDTSAAQEFRTELDTSLSKQRAIATDLEQLKAANKHASEWLRELREGHVKVRDRTAAMREDYGTATSALAQDIASLAGECARLRDGHQTLQDSMVQERAQLEQQLELKRAKDVKVWSEQLDSLGREVRLMQDSTRKAAQESAAGAGRMRSLVEEGMANSTDEVRTAMQQMRSTEAALRAQHQELSERLREQGTEMERQHGAMHHAVSAIADVLHISAPLVHL